MTTLVDGAILSISTSVVYIKGGILINQMFLNLEPEKQWKILNAAFDEFAEHGFEKASTNRIVKEAGIGKGMLFYYFNSKKELYSYLVDYGIGFIMDKYLILLNEQETDFIERYRQATQIKMIAYADNPYVFKFLGTMFINTEEIPEELNKRLDEARNVGFRKMYHNINTSLFREDINPDIIMKMIHFTLDGYEKDLLNRLRGKKITPEVLDPLWDEFYEYLDVLKKVYYK